MSIFKDERLEIFTGFKDIEEILEESLSRTIKGKPIICDYIVDLSQMKDQKLKQLYQGGNVISTFKAGEKICGNFELAGAWNSKDEPFFYINKFQIVINYPLEMRQISRHEVKVGKTKEGKASEIHVRKVALKTQTLSKSGSGYKKTLLASAVVLSAIYFQGDLIHRSTFDHLKYAVKDAFWSVGMLLVSPEIIITSFL